jgi:ribonuclease E
VGTQADETTESAEPPTAPADSQALDDVGQADPTVSGAGEVVDAPESREPESMEAVEVGPGREESAHADPAEVSESIAEGDSPTVDDPDGAEATDDDGPRRRRRRGGRGRRRRTGDDERPETEQPNGGDPADDEASASPTAETDSDDETEAETGSSRRRRRRRRRAGGDDGASPDDPPNTVVRVRQSRRDDVTGLKGSTRLEAKRQRRREGRESGRRRQVVTEAEFLARRESVDRAMLVRDRDGRTQIVVLEDDVLVEHYVARKSAASMIGNIYLGKVQNVLPSMEAAFIDIGKGRNAVLYAGEVNWDAAGLAGQPRRIELALKAGDPVLAQVSKDPVGHKGARLTSQVSLPGRYLVYVPNSSITGISRKLPDTERNRLKRILRAVVPEEAGVIVRTAAEGASEDELRRDVERLQRQWAEVEKRAKAVSPPTLLHGEPDLTIKVIRDVFNEDFKRLVVSGEEAWNQVSSYVEQVAPDLSDRVSRWDGDGDIFAAKRIDEQIAKGLERKVWLPSGGSLVIDRTEAMTVVDVNTGKFVGAGGNLEETVTRNNLEAAEEIVRQLRLRDIGGIIVVDFIDMVLESNRDLVLRRLIECLGRDRTKHQVAEVTSLGLVQMTRKRVGQGLLESFSDPCEACGGRGVHLHEAPSQPTATPRQEAPRRGHFEAQRVAEAARKAKEREVAKLGGTAEQSDEAPTVEAPTVEAPTEEAAAVEAATGDQAAGQTPSAEGAPPQDHQDHQDRSGPDDSEPAEPAQLGGELLDSGSGGEPHAAGTEVRADDRPEPAGDPDHAGTGAEAPDAGAAGTAPSSPPPPTRPGGSADTVAVGFESAPDVSETPDEPDQPGESEQTTHTDPGPPV